MRQWPQAINKPSACFSERSESVGDSNFPDKSSDLSDGQTGMSGQGVRFTGMFPHAGMTKKAQLLAGKFVGARDFLVTLSSFEKVTG